MFNTHRTYDYNDEPTPLSGDPNGPHTRNRHTKFGLMSFDVEPLKYQNSRGSWMWLITTPWGEKLPPCPECAINTAIHGTVVEYEARRFAHEARKAQKVMVKS